MKDGEVQCKTNKKKKIMDQLIRITAPHYVAGLEIRNGYVVNWPPILRWTAGKSWPTVESYFIRKQYKIEYVSTKSRQIKRRRK